MIVIKTLAVIGTAGRKDDADRISRGLYDAMYGELAFLVSHWGIKKAVSGGAAVADHLAVRAFNEGLVDALTLFLPANFYNGSYVPNPRVRFNPGQTSNKYHRSFSKLCDIDSLREIDFAIRNGARVIVNEGFHMRNSDVADSCTHMVAMTFGNRPKGVFEMVSPHTAIFNTGSEAYRNSQAAGLKDGGTAHCWGECWKALEKAHVNLSSAISSTSQ